MKVIAYNGFYFCGKLKDLLKELHDMSKTYKTLQDLITKTKQ